jgi:hypothetical protein
MLDPQLHKLAYPCASVEQHLDHEPVLAGMFISCLDQTLNLGTVEPIHRTSALLGRFDLEFAAGVLDDVLGLVISKVMLAP